VKEAIGLATELPFEKPLTELRLKIEELRRFTEEKDIDMSDEVAHLEARAKELAETIYRDLKPWQKVQIARHPERPTTLDYIRAICEDFIELHGDRNFRDDPAIVGGIGRIGAQPVTVIGTQKGRDTKDNLMRNFGMAHPEGYRKALRLMKQAEKFGRPVVIFIDTAGAYPGPAAEERGQGEAIARNLIEMAVLRVPIICTVTGEGGSGGALGLGLGDRVLMLEHAWYSVIAPESAAAILWKDSTQGQRAADVMCITAQDLLRFGIVDEIIAEPFGGAHRDRSTMTLTVSERIRHHLDELCAIADPAVLVAARYDKFRRIGEWRVEEAKPAAEPVAEVEAPVGTDT
jgi:acetyl-CoA carboxylase carboxyl transferase subunit alpha